MDTSMPKLESCPLCGADKATLWDRRGDRATLRCFTCGEHDITMSLLNDALNWAADEYRQACIGHFVVQLPPDTLITTSLVRRAPTELPSPLERIDLLLSFLASEVAPGEAYDGALKPLNARLGCENKRATRWVIEQAEAERLVQQVDTTGLRPRLTAQGWMRVDQLRRDGAGSRHAFMAMKYGDEQLNEVFTGGMQPAVALTGFELRMLAGPHQTAGSIDNRMRVEIRTSRFMVCDLTHGNRGAYWEAGFAEGIGRPVFYTCRRDVLHDRRHPDHPHFDTAHQLIIPWAQDTLTDDMQALKDAIRATLPAEARMEDA